MKHYKKMMVILLLFVLAALPSCAHVKAVYVNDSNRIYVDTAGKGVCEKIEFDCVVMSKGQFRELAKVEPEDGKQFVITYK